MSEVGSTWEWSVCTADWGGGGKEVKAVWEIGLRYE